ncbi:hypothetical protein HDU98_004625 [Podochytrium sp. JEL0797]|nr:hypothetical protein HDU98_004625 [Podochytrium sp. JEL0797]
MGILLPGLGLWCFPFAGLTFAAQIPIIRCRRKNRISIGDGTAQLAAMIAADKPAAETAKFKEAVKQLGFHIRAHANLMENLPLNLLVIGVAELNGVDARLIHGLLAALFVGRALHWRAMSDGPKTGGAASGRAFGVITTNFVNVVASVASIWMILRA